jgi:hypothetical protein
MKIGGDVRILFPLLPLREVLRPLTVWVLPLEEACWALDT